MDEFERWLAAASAAEEGCEGVFLPGVPRPYYLTPGQVRRLIAHLHRLAGHAPGTLPAGELEAIRGRAEGAAEGPWDSGKGDGRSAIVSGPNGLGISIALPSEFYSAWKDTAEFVAHARADVPALLRALDSALADLAAAEGALHDLTSPDQTDGSPAYARGVEAGETLERARCAALLRLTAGDHRRFLPQATPGAGKRVVTSVIAALENAADLVESPPAPAAAPGGGEP